MSMAPYQPALGTSADKAIKLLLGKAPGTSVTRLFLADYLGIGKSSVTNVLKNAVHNEFLIRSTTELGTVTYGLGPAALGHAGALSSNPSQEQSDAFEHVLQHVVPASGRAAPATTGVKSVFHLAGVLPDDMPTSADFGPTTKPLPRQQLTVAAPAATPVPGLRCGLFNNGDLVINASRGELVIDREEVRDLVDYLNKISTALKDAR